MCDCNPQGIDLVTPRNVHLSAIYKRSFAYHTVKHRMPIILTQTIDNLARSKEAIEMKYGPEGQQDLKEVIGELSKLNYEVQTNKPFRNLESEASDVQFYNDYLKRQVAKEGNVTFFTTVWLYAECYMYRRMREAFELTKCLKHYDPFLKQKQEAHFNALPLINNLSQYLVALLQQEKEAEMDEFIKLLKINLWGNKCDLSLSNGQVNTNTELLNIEALNNNILCDHSKQIWEALQNKTSDIVDIVFDNAGYEIFTDLCIADYLISKNITKNVRFYVKSIPWFISDVLTDDFRWTLQQLAQNPSGPLQELGKKWTNYVNDKTWTLVENDFWTLPVDFSQMANVNPSLYKKLAESDLVIFKGDLNYRKLFGEKNWDPVTPVDEALQNFNPARLCTLRTIKSDIVCGLPKGLAEKAYEVNEKWMETGDFAVIQFSDKIVSIR